MSSIAIKGFAILCLVSVLVIAASAVPTPAVAREPEPGIIDFMNNSVGGEPGEDPHLRTDPGARAHVIWEQGGQGENRETVDERMRRVGECRVLGERASGGFARSNWRTIFYIWILSIVSR